MKSRRDLKVNAKVIEAKGELDSETRSRKMAHRSTLEPLGLRETT